MGEVTFDVRPMKHDGINSDPCLFWAWYASVVDRSEASQRAQAWWERIDARYLAMTGEHVLDPIRYTDPVVGSR